MEVCGKALLDHDLLHGTQGLAFPADREHRIAKRSHEFGGRCPGPMEDAIKLRRLSRKAAFFKRRGQGMERLGAGGVGHVRAYLTSAVNGPQWSTQRRRMAATLATDVGPFDEHIKEDARSTT